MPAAGASAPWFARRALPVATRSSGTAATARGGGCGPVSPVVSYGITPYFTAYPGTVTLRSATFLSLVREILEGISEAGFRRILIVNGHGGNAPAQALAAEWAAEHPGARIQFHNWWN